MRIPPGFCETWRSDTSALVTVVEIDTSGAPVERGPRRSRRSPPAGGSSRPALRPWQRERRVDRAAWGHTRGLAAQTGQVIPGALGATGRLALAFDAAGLERLPLVLGFD